MTAAGIDALEVGKIHAGEYLIEGFRVYRDDIGLWVVKGKGASGGTAYHHCRTMRDAKALIVDHINGVRVIR